jgi:hypothetical protein
VRVPAGKPAVETYPCIGCNEVVEPGRARLGSVTCHDCATMGAAHHWSPSAAPTMPSPAPSSPLHTPTS